MFDKTRIFVWTPTVNNPLVNFRSFLVCRLVLIVGQSVLLLSVPVLKHMESILVLIAYTDTELNCIVFS